MYTIESQVEMLETFKLIDASYAYWSHKEGFVELALFVPLH